MSGRGGEWLYLQGITNNSYTMRLKRLLLPAALSLALAACSDKDKGGGNEDDGFLIVKTPAEFEAAVEAATGTAAEPVRIRLGADMQSFIGWNDAPKFLEIDGGGHTLTQTKKYTNMPLVDVESAGSRFLLTNIVLDGSGYEGSNHPICVLGSDTELTLGSGVVLKAMPGRAFDQNSNGIFVTQGGKVIFDGVRIEGNSAPGCEITGYTDGVIEWRSGVVRDNGEYSLRLTSSAKPVRIAGSVGDGNELKLFFEDKDNAVNGDGAVIAEGIGGYTLTESDRACFTLVTIAGENQYIGLYDVELDNNRLLLRKFRNEALEALQAQIDAAGSDPANPTKITLTQDIVVTATIEVGNEEGTASRAVEIDGRGHKLSFHPATQWLIRSNRNSCLRLTDVTLDGGNAKTINGLVGTGNAASVTLGSGTTLQNLKNLDPVFCVGIAIAQGASLTVEDGASFKNIEGAAIVSQDADVRIEGGSFSGCGAEIRVTHSPSRITGFSKWPSLDGKFKVRLQYYPSGSTVFTALGGYAFPDAEGFSLLYSSDSNGNDITGQRQLVLEDGAIKIKDK